MKTFHRHTPLYAAIALALTTPTYAADFTIANGDTETTQQVLNGGETGTIEAGGTLDTGGTSSGIRVNGAMNQINNAGTITTTTQTAVDIGGVTPSDTTLVNSGTISTTGDNAHAIYSGSDNDDITNTGTISTTGNSAIAIILEGLDTTLTNSGTITSTNSRAIFTTSDNVTIINDGSITAGSVGMRLNGNNTTAINNGDINAYNSGMYADSGSVTLINNGSITAGGYGLYIEEQNSTATNNGTINSGGTAIQVAGDDSTATNNGDITTTGNASNGIYGDNGAVNQTLINTGTINTSGNNAHGIRSDSGGNAIVSNSGTISTSGNSANGIDSDGDNITITNSGTITVTGLSSRGINSDGNNDVITNTGTVNSSGAGIRADGDNASIINTGVVISDTAAALSLQGSASTLNNSGSVTTTGDGETGAYLYANQITATNSGSITVTGYNAEAIHIDGNDVTVNNSGSIHATGDDSYGISVNYGSTNTTINNSGIISATGANSYAIGNSDGATGVDTTLNVLAGSQIIGRIDLGDDGGDNDTANVYGGGVSGSLTFENTENINVFGSAALVGNTVVTMDQTGESTRGVALAGMTSAIHNVIGQRMAQTTPLKPVQLASLELSPGMYFEEHKPVAWAQVFGGTFDRDAEGSALAYDYDHVGINFGYEWDVNNLRAGLMGGFVQTDTDTQTASFSSEGDNYYIGAYANKKMSGVSLTGSLLAGYGDYDNDRLVVDNINGIETAKSDFDSFFISPSLTLASAYTVDDRLELRPSASIAYSMAWLDGYTESGTTNSNLKVDDREAKALTARLQLAAAYKLTEGSEFEFRVGMNSRHTDDEDTKVSIAGSNFKFATAADENVTSGFAGASLRVAHDDNLSLVADMEFGGDSDEDYVAGNISLQYVF